MKHLKTYENLETDQKYIVVDFFEHDSNTNLYVFEVYADTFTKKYMKIIKFYYYDGVLSKTVSPIEYVDYDSYIKILYETNSEKEAIEKLKDVVKFYADQKKYNL